MNAHHTATTRELSLPRLRRLVRRALLGLGLTSEQASIVRDVLLYAELRGNAQGLIKILERTVVPSPDAELADIERITPTLARVRARGEPGMVVLQGASDLLAGMATTHGLALVTTVGTDTSSGALGYYAQRIARHGLIALVAAGSPKTMALHGGRSPVLGSNALALAVPVAGHDPLLLDMTTAATPVFNLHRARYRGEPIAEGLALDSAGRPTVDAVQALAGALLPWGGAKGSGLALMLEILTGPLTGAAIVGDPIDSRGNVLLALNPAVIAPDGTFDERLSQFLHRLESIDGGARLPGVASQHRASEHERRGSLELELDLVDALRRLALATRLSEQ